MNLVNLQVGDRLYQSNTQGAEKKTDNGHGRRSIMSFTICFSLGEQACLSSEFLVVLTEAASLVDWPKLLPFSSKAQSQYEHQHYWWMGSTSPPMLRELNEDSIYF